MIDDENTKLTNIEGIPYQYMFIVRCLFVSFF